jgi:hypothetical protein
VPPEDLSMTKDLSSTEVLICTAKVRVGESLENCTRPRANQDPAATNRHCQQCQTAAKRRYEMSKESQTSGRAWHEGVETMAEYLADQFAKYSSRDGSGNYIQRFAGPEIADIIRRCERPKFGETSLPSEATS